jgi:hypothetical protein
VLGPTMGTWANSGEATEGQTREAKKLEGKKARGQSEDVNLAGQ